MFCFSLKKLNDSKGRLSRLEFRLRSQRKSSGSLVDMSEKVSAGKSGMRVRQSDQGSLLTSFPVLGRLSMPWLYPGCCFWL